MKIKLFIICFISLIISTKSQTLINSFIKETNFFPGSQPSGILQVGNNLIFTANTGYGNEPYKYDLQTQNAELIQNINGSSGNSMIKNEFYKINNKVYYFATDNSNFQLWSTDLATNITSKIKDFNIYYSSTNEIVAKVFNNKLFFVFQQKLYVSDGTITGTFHINNVSNVGKYLQENNGSVFFFGSDNIYGKEVWKTDGTISGTTIVKDINVGANSAIDYGYEKMYSFNNKIIFIARDSNYNLGLWSTDGNSSNTINFHSLNSSETFYDFDFGNINSLIFKVNDDLWKTDGTSTGTNLIYNNIPTINKITYFKNKTYIDTNTNIYYVDQSNQVNILNNSFGVILQTIAPSNNGNYLALKEYNNDSSQIYFFDGTNFSQTDIKFAFDNKFIEFQNKLIFSGYLESYTDFNTIYKNTELFSYTPINNISKIEKDLIYSSPGIPRYYTSLNGEIFFLARVGSNYQVYKIDINNNILKLSNDLQEYFPDNIENYNPAIVSGNYIYFHSDKLIRTNSVANSTQQISTPVNEKIYGTYSLNDNQIIIKTFNNTDNYIRIWSLPNDSTNFSLLVERPFTSMPYSLSNVDNDFVKTDSGIYFKMINNSTTEIWKSNGTINTTTKITDLYNIYAFNSFLGSLNNKIFFSDNQNYSYNNTKLYYIDETTNQVNLVKDSYHYIEGKSFTKNNQLFFFSGTGNGFITALNVTDGTLQNTQLVTQINSEGAYEIKKCGNLNYFLDYHRQKLFRTDGTASGTFLVTSGTQYYSKLNCMNNELYGLDSMQKIFKTNGNSGNYQQLNFTINNQVLQQPNYSWIKSLYTNNSKIYFSVDQYNNHGEELFVTESINSLNVIEENNTGNEKILLYPNPAVNKVNIKLNDKEKIIKIIMYDINGSIISTYFNQPINIQNIPTGLYFLRVITDVREYNSKLIKK